MHIFSLAPSFMQWTSLRIDGPFPVELWTASRGRVDRFPWNIQQVHKNSRAIDGGT